MMSWSRLCVGIVLIHIFVSKVESHGVLTDPPSRNYAWKAGFSSPPNYSYKSLFCGGKSVQWGTYSGKCGACGDSYDPNKVKEHSDLSGKYVKKSEIVKTYTQGEKISVTVKVTAYHKGWFEFRLCKLKNSEQAPTSRNTEVTQECLDENLLTLYVGDDATTRLDLETTKSQIKTGNDFTFMLKLPDDIYCDYCVLQWWYKTDIAITQTNQRNDENPTDDNAPNGNTDDNTNGNKPSSGNVDFSLSELMDLEERQLEVMVWSARQSRNTVRFLEQELAGQLEQIVDELEELKYNFQNRK